MFILEKTEITKTTALIMCTVIILGLIMYIFIIKEFAKKDNDYKKLGLEIKESNIEYSTIYDYDMLYKYKVYKIKNYNNNMEKFKKQLEDNDDWSKNKFLKYATEFKLPKDKKIKDFSRGMKMKLSIAVALSHDAKLLILDEATSSLDNETEKNIQESLNKLSKNRTTLVVAHRLATIRNVDRIIVLSSNGISEQGSHDELMALQGEYYRLYMAQFEEQ